MPTPFHHLSLAGELLVNPGLPGAIRQFLHASRCVFLFGSTAPDVQVVSGQPRQVTHFFNLPIQAGDRPAWEVMLSKYPNLSHGENLPTRQAIFLAGYLCHLQADWHWVKDIFAPIFGPTCTWGTFQQRLYYHNVLRAHLDRYILTELEPHLAACLSQVEPRGWLPFVENRFLAEWRDLLAPQLRPGAATQTVEVFSSRQGVSPPEFQALLESEKRMQMEVLAHLPDGHLQLFREKVIEENTRLLSDYLAFTLHQNHITIEGNFVEGVQQ